MNNNIKYGIVGVGHLGRFHVEHIQKMPNVTLVGIFDSDLSIAKKVAAKHKTIAFEKLKNHIDIASAFKTKQGIRVGLDGVVTAKIKSLLGLTN